MTGSVVQISGRGLRRAGKIPPLAGRTYYFVRNCVVRNKKAHPITRRVVQDIR
ncbi:hypothetical protein HNQ91_002515 [Filimonas zeae]|nr:hypothetical protein [Filimonas zeae]